MRILPARSDDQYRTLRDRMADRRRDDGIAPQPTAARRLVSIYDAGSMPNQPDHFYAAHPVQLSAGATEGGIEAPYIDTATTLYVDVLRHAPAVGDILVAHLAGGRWVAERGRGAPPCSAWFCGPFVTIDAPPTISFTCAAALALVDVQPDGTLANLRVIQAGSCYEANPHVVITRPGGGGTTATATATVGGVTTLFPTDAGKGYAAPPTVTIAPPGGSGRSATATATIGPGGAIVGLALTDGGSLYGVANPTVTIAPPPPGGRLATATANARPGIITSLALTNPGTDYTIDNTVPRAFDVTIAGPGLTIGPVRVTLRGGSEIQVPNVDFCLWAGGTTFDVPATDACPGLPGVPLTIGVAFTSTGSYQISMRFGAGQAADNFEGPPPGAIAIPCGEPANVNTTGYMGDSLYCLEIPGQPPGNNAAGFTYDVFVPTCTARPYSGSLTIVASPQAPPVFLANNPTADLYLLFGGRCPNGVNGGQPTVLIVTTMTEVTP